MLCKFSPSFIIYIDSPDGPTIKISCSINLLLVFRGIATLILSVDGLLGGKKIVRLEVGEKRPEEKCGPRNQFSYHKDN